MRHKRRKKKIPVLTIGDEVHVKAFGQTYTLVFTEASVGFNSPTTARLEDLSTQLRT